jgi:hypothetical protein
VVKSVLPRTKRSVSSPFQSCDTDFQTKDEQYINLMLYDVYRVTGADGPPHGSGFVLRRSKHLFLSVELGLIIQLKLLEISGA